MAIDFSLAPRPVNYLEPLQAMALGQQAARQRAADARAEQDRQRSDQTRATVSTRLNAKDYVGAETAAISGGDPELAGHIASLDTAARARVADGFNTIGSLAYSLKQVPLEERAARFQAAIPLLRAHGLSDEVLQHADLSDAGLDGYVNASLSVKDQMEAHKPTPVGADSLLVDPVSGRVIANNPKPVDFQHVTLTRGDGGQDGYTFNPRSGQWESGGPGATTPGVPGGSGPVPTGVGVSPKAAAVASTLTAAGLPAPVVAGFMGNFHVEGGYDGAQGDGGSASGIGQWHADRAATFQRVIGKPVTEATPAEQARFVVWEMQNPQAAGMTVAQRDAILAAKTAPEAAALIDQHYERSSGRDRQTRMAAASAFAGDTAAGPGGGGGAPHPAVSSAGKPEEPPLSPEERHQLAAAYKISRVLPPIARDKATVRQILNDAGSMTMEEAHRIADGQVQTWQDTKAAGETITAFAKGQEARQVRSLSVAIEHLELYRQAAKALNSGNVPAFNSLAQTIARATGHPAPTNAAALHDLVMDEVVKGVVGTAAGVGDREKAAQILTQNSSPAQMAGGFDQIGGLLLGQLHGLQQQYESGTGRTDFGHHLTPMATRVFEEYQRAHGQGGGAHRISSDAEYNLLRSGTHFIGPDGHERVKP